MSGLRKSKIPSEVYEITFAACGCQYRVAADKSIQAIQKAWTAHAKVDCAAERSVVETLRHLGSLI